MQVERYVLYHRHCQDGLGARYAAYKKFGNDATYISVQYKEPIPQEIEEALVNKKSIEVYIVDFSYSRDTLTQLTDLVGVEKLVVLDHHITAQEDLEGLNLPNTEIIFDTNKSGAMLAWEYFHPGKPVPYAIELIQDRDLWKFKHKEDTKSFFAAVMTLGWDFDLFSRHVGDTSKILETDFMKLGRTITVHHDALVKQAVKNTIVVQFDTLRLGLLNHPKILHSEVGHTICEDKSLNVDFSITWYVQPNGLVELSLRSRADRPDIDVSKIAKNLGGGGHETSAGAIVGMSFVQGLYQQQVK